MLDSEVLNNAIAFFGEESRVDMFIEEAFELITVLMHERRGWLEHFHKSIQEEIADVKIMLAQLEIIFGNGLIDSFVEEKLMRLEQRILENS